MGELTKSKESTRKQGRIKVCVLVWMVDTMDMLGAGYDFNTLPLPPPPRGAALAELKAQPFVPPPGNGDAEIVKLGLE